MSDVTVADRTISEILDDLDDQDMKVYAWRLYTLEKAGFAVGPAILIARERHASLRQAERMKLAGCPDELVARILT